MLQLQYVQLHIIITTAAYLIIVSSICLRDSSFKSLSFQQMMATPFSPPASIACQSQKQFSMLNKRFASIFFSNMYERIEKKQQKGRVSFFEYLLSLYLNALFRLLFENADRVLQSLNLLHR